MPPASSKNIGVARFDASSRARINGKLRGEPGVPSDSLTDDIYGSLTTPSMALLRPHADNEASGHERSASVHRCRSTPMPARRVPADLLPRGVTIRGSAAASLEDAPCRTIPP